ncbi:MAG: GH3 auxin-responsive promoter family protein [Saprospiraceae bacterium]
MEEVQTGVHYALALPAPYAGAWRYLLGDTIQFTNVEHSEFRITGRTKQFLSACGEHLSIDNLSAAVKAVDDQLHGRSEESLQGSPAKVFGLINGMYPWTTSVPLKNL